MFTKPLISFFWSTPEETAYKRVTDFYNKGMDYRIDEAKMEDAINSAIDQCKSECNELQRIRENFITSKNQRRETVSILNMRKSQVFDPYDPDNRYYRENILIDKNLDEVSKLMVQFWEPIDAGVFPANIGTNIHPNTVILQEKEKSAIQMVAEKMGREFGMNMTEFTERLNSINCFGGSTDFQNRVKKMERKINSINWKDGKK